MNMVLGPPLCGDMQQLSEHANHCMLAAIWPIQLQGSAAYDVEQFRIFSDRLASLEPVVEAGHRGRARFLLDQVSARLEEVRIIRNRLVIAHTVKTAVSLPNRHWSGGAIQ